MSKECPDFEVSFERALISFSGYPDKIPNAVFRSALRIIESEGIPFDEACQAITDIVKISREEVRAKLEKCRPRQSETEKATSIKRDRIGLLPIGSRSIWSS